jgi:hypothetical protein
MCATTGRWTVLRPRGCRRLWSVLGFLIVPHAALAQEAGWTGQAQCQLSVDSATYTYQETQTWQLTGQPPGTGSLAVYPATWSVTGQGQRKDVQGGLAATTRWKTDVPPMSGTVAIFVNSARQLIIKSYHAQLVARDAASGTTDVADPNAVKPAAQARSVFEWQFPAIQDAATSTDVSGSTSTPIASGIGPMQPPGLKGVAACQWHFSKGGAAATSVSAPFRPKPVEQIAGTVAAPTTTATKPGSDGAAGAAGAAAGGSAAGAQAGAGVSAGAGAPGASAKGGAAASGAAAGGSAAGAQAGAGASAGAGAPGASAKGGAAASSPAAGGGAAAGAAGGASDPNSGPGGAGATSAAPGSGAAAGSAAGGATTGGVAGAVSSAAAGTGALQTGAKEIGNTASQKNPLFPKLVQVSPSRVLQNTRGVPVTLTGSNTHFVQGTTTASFGQGVSVVQVSVSSPTQATATVNVDVSADATNGGLRTVTVTTGREVLSAPSGFTVGLNASPVITQVFPGQGEQDQSRRLTITGRSTNFVQGATTVAMGPGIAVTGVTISSPTSATADVHVDPTATAGVRDVTLTTGTETATASQAFTVQAVPKTAYLNITTVRAGSTVQLTVTGQGTHFAQNLTTAVGLPGFASLSVSSPTITYVNLELGSASTGVYGSQGDFPLGSLHTAGEVANLQGTLTVTAVPDNFGHSYTTATPLGAMTRPIQKTFEGVMGSASQEDCFSFHFDNAINPAGNYPDPDPVTIAIFGPGAAFQLVAFHNDQSYWTATNSPGQLVLKDVPDNYFAVVCVRSMSWVPRAPKYTLTFSVY